MAVISIADAMDEMSIKVAVSEKVPECWRRASLVLTGSDNESTYSFFMEKTEGVRIELVRKFFEQKAPWSTFLVQAIPKRASWGTVAAAARRRRSPWRSDPDEKTRLISFDARVDHAAQLVLLRLLGSVLKKGTPTNVIGFVPGVNPFKRLVGIMANIQSDPRRFRFARAFDLKTAFDVLDWSLLDRAVDQHLGEIVGGLPRVDHHLRAALKGLARVRMQHRDGTPVPRAQGVPQGAVMSPLLLNLYLKTLDQRVIRRLHDRGCGYYRYADDMLIVGPTIEAIEEASAILKEEIAKVRLTVKDGTGKLCDLRNPQNPVEWLGIEFSHKRVTVPRSRIEAKAADLLLRLRRRQLGPQGLDASLVALREHYICLVGDDEANKGVESIRRLLRPFLHDLPEEKGDIEHILKQLPLWRTGRSARSRTTPMGHHHRDGDPPRSTSSGPTWGSPTLTVPTAVPGLGDDQGPHEERSYLSSDTPDGRGSSAPTASSTGRRSPGAIRGSSSRSSASSPSNFGCPLAADSASQLSDRPRPASSPKPQEQVRYGKHESTPGDDTKPFVRVVAPTKGRNAGRVFLRFSDGRLVARPVTSGARSSSETVLGAYGLAMAELRSFEGLIFLRVTNAVVAAHVFAKHRIRSPRILKRWIALVPLLDGRVVFERLLSSGRLSVPVEMPI